MPTTLEEHHHMLVEKAKSAGKKLAITNLPSLQSDEKLEGYIQSIRSSYSGLLAQEQRKNPINQNDIAEIESRSSEQKYDKLSERYTEIKNRLRHEQVDGNENKLPAKIAALDGCAAVYCLAAGASAVKQLLAAGVQPVRLDDEAAIEPLLRQINAAIREGGIGWVDRAVRQQRDGAVDASRFDRMAEESWEE